MANAQFVTACRFHTLRYLLPCLSCQAQLNGVSMKAKKTKNQACTASAGVPHRRRTLRQESRAFCSPGKKSGSLDFLKQSELSNWCCITLCITVYMSCRRLSFNASLYLDGCFQYSLIYNPSKFSDNWVSGRYHFLPLKLNKWCPFLYTYGGHEAPETWTPFNCEPSSRLVP